MAELIYRRSVTSVKTSAYAAGFGQTVLCDPSGGGFTVTLPTGTSEDVGRTVEVKNVSTSANTIAIDGDGANIDGASSIGLSSPLGAVVVQYTGSAWAVIEQTPNRPTCGSFTAATDEALDTEVESNAVTLSGDSGMTWPLTVRGDGTPQLELNDDGEWLTHVVAMAGDEVKVKLTSSASPETERTATLYGPGLAKLFSVTTGADLDQYILALPGLIGYWLMEATSGTTEPNAANPGTLDGAYQQNGTGTFTLNQTAITTHGARAAAFTGANGATGTNHGCLDLGDDSALTPTGGITVGLWINTPNPTNQYMMMAAKATGSNSTYELRMNGGNARPEFAIGTNGTHYIVTCDGTTLNGIIGATALQANTRYLVVGRWDAGNHKLDIFINGQKAATSVNTAGTGVLFSVTENLRLGVRRADTAANGQYPYTGRMERAFLVGGAISDAAIAQIYAMGTS